MFDAFAHERLVVYQKSMSFLASRRELLDQLPRQAAAADHLERAAESILVNIARAQNSQSTKDRIVSLGHANGSALECAACLDILVIKRLIAPAQATTNKHVLAEIVSMLITMRKTASGRMQETPASYRTKAGNLFDHEDLAAYQSSLQLIAWLDPTLARFACSTDLRQKIDRSSTSIPLNIAEGSGRFTKADKANFYNSARNSAIHTAALLGLASNGQDEEGRALLSRISALLKALSNSMTKSTDDHHTILHPPPYTKNPRQR